MKFKPSHPSCFSALLRISALLLLIGTMLLTVVSCKSGATQEPETELPTTKVEDQPMEIPEQLAISAAGGFRRINGVLTTYITQDSPILALSNRIEVAKGASWTLSADQSGENVLEGKTATLKDGENRLFVTVKHRTDTFVHELIVNYHAAYTVEFFTNCSYVIETQTVEMGASPFEPVKPKRDGYEFLGWFLNGNAYSFTQPLDKDTVLTAHWHKTVDAFLPSDTSVPQFEGINASMNAVWKDYGNSFGLRPESVTCILTELCGESKTEYRITLSQNGAVWQDATAPAGATLTQGEGGAWTLSIKNLPQSKNGTPCSYTLLQEPLSGDYSTVQSRSSAINTISDYMPLVDDSAKLSTQNARLYDAAGNMIVLNGVVTINAGKKGFDSHISTQALTRLKQIGCNAIRITVQLIGINSGEGYVYYYNGSSRTGDYNDTKDKRMTATDKQKMLSSLYEAIDNASEVGMYVVVDWGILTSDPNQYLNDAKEFFGTVSQKYANNPYVIYEICNEPVATWGLSNGASKSIKAYAEALISVIRANGSNGIVIVAPNNSATALSAYSGKGTAGDDPIDVPLNEDLAHHVAYTFHCYPYNYAYSTYSWKLRDAHEAGLTVITTEMSPMDGTFDSPDTLTYDMEEAAKFLRMYQEWDMSLFYFRYESPSTTNALYYHENAMLLPNINVTLEKWSREDLTGCGRWYYDLLTGGGVFTCPDYTTVQKKLTRPTVDGIYSAFGISNVFPGFSVSASQNGATTFFRVSDSDELSDAQFAAYCLVIFNQIDKASGSTVQSTGGGAYTKDNLPKSTDTSMSVTYQYQGKTVRLDISYAKNATANAYGITVTVQESN